MSNKIPPFKDRGVGLTIKNSQHQKQLSTNWNQEPSTITRNCASLVNIQVEENYPDSPNGDWKNIAFSFYGPAVISKNNLEKPRGITH